MMIFFPPGRFSPTSAPIVVVFAFDARPTRFRFRENDRQPPTAATGKLVRPGVASLPENRDYTAALQAQR